MVSTKASQTYTFYALKSFFAHTPVATEDRFFLIDHDQSLSPEELHPFPKCERILHEQRKSFSENLNFVMELAEREQADLYFLNNDLIFTEGWISAMEEERPAILSPFTNREFHYVGGDFVCETNLNLEQYQGKEAVFDQIARHHRERNLPSCSVFFIPFFCIKIPYGIYSVLGKLDESFGKGGAEDNDYCLRAYLAGFEVSYASTSFVLHFGGKSFWTGGENPLKKLQREGLFRKRFRQKWGEPLLRLSIDGDKSVLDDYCEAKAAFERNDLKAGIEILATHQQG